MRSPDPASDDYEKNIEKPEKPEKPETTHKNLDLVQSYSVYGAMLYTYTAITNKILVSATPYLIKEKSRPKDQHFVYAYHIRIKNDGETPIILQRRFWRIRHGKNKQEEILGGEGVVGQYPQINPGEEFEYQSFCPIPPFGSMRGHFQFIDKK